MQQCVSALVRRREMGAFKSSPSNARLPTWEVLTVVFWRKAPITWPAIPHQKLITTNKQTNTERGLELKTKKSSCIFSNFYLSFPHNIRVHTSDRIPTLSVNHRLFADWYTRWGDFGLESFFFFPLLYHYMLISRADNAVGALMPRSLSLGYCWSLPGNRVYESFGPALPGRQSNPASALGKREEDKNKE